MDDFYMECVNDNCNKKYDVNCLNILPGAFKALTKAYKEKWVCPECICLHPKKGNLETPVRGTRVDSDVATTPINNVNTQRGSQLRFSPVMMEAEYDTALLNELRQFRADMVTRLDSQENAIKHLQNQFSQTKSDLNQLVKIIRVIEEKIDSKLTRPPPHKVNEQVIIDDSPCSSSAKIHRQNTTAKTAKTSTKKSINIQPTDKPRNVNNGGATKSAVHTPPTYSSKSTIPATESLNQDESKQGGWDTVQYRKRNRMSKDVRRGMNTDLQAIQATERKKYLHVWRLHPETTVEAVSDHIKNICGSEISIKIDKIQHKTERDYSSFKIGVPERMYENLNKAEVWPLNAEFNEWIFFRRSTTKKNDTQH